MALIWVNSAAELSDNLVRRVGFGSSLALRFMQRSRNREWGWNENGRRR
jgi:hypothetical protein